MAPETLIVTEPTRLDRLVASIASVGSRGRARTAIESGKVAVDGEICREAGATIPAGATVALSWNRPGTGADRRKGQAGLVEAGLRILYEDPHVVAVDKPSGLLTDTASEEQHRTRDSVWKRLRAWLKPRGDRPFTVHRIDRDTTGVVLFARTEAAERNLRDQFRSHQPERVYHALVAGIPHPEVQTWEDHTRWNKGRRILESVTPETPGGRPTRCEVQVVRRFADTAEIEVRLDTGRRNQIRLQAALRGHPLLGERLYVERQVGPPAPRQLLHARRLVVRHPATGADLVVTAPFPDDWRAVVRRLAARP